MTVFSRTCAALAGEACTRALDLPASLAGGGAPKADFIALRESRRSEPAIVAFVNAFSTVDFASHEPSSPHDVPMRYGPGEELVSVRDDEGGRVELLRDDGATAPDAILASAPSPLREAFLAAAAARRLCAEGLRWGDIAILARRRSTIPLVELALGRVGAPYVVAGRALYDTLEVRDVAALVRLVLDPNDRHALATVLRGPTVALSDGALATLTGERGLDRRILAEGDRVRLDREAFPVETARLDAFAERFVAARAGLMRLSPGEALRAMVRVFDLDRVLAALPRATARVGNVDRLIAIAAGRGGSLLAFSRWLERQIADETDEREAVVFAPEDDAVRLTTIHAAKGLDFEATIILDLAARPAPDASPLVFLRADAGSAAPRFVFLHRADGGIDIPSAARAEAKRVARERSQSERRRITYVAFTRAKRRLLLVAPAADGSAGSALATIDAHRDGALEDRLFDPPASEWLEESLAPLPPEPATAAETRARPAALRAKPRSLPIATTPLGVFRGCARRFRLRFLAGLEEPVDTGQLDLFEVGEVERRVEPLERDDGDPRKAGRAAHRLLESWPKERFGVAPSLEELLALLEKDALGPTEAARIATAVRDVVASDFAAELATSDIHREEESLVTIAPSAPGAPSLELRGTIDLWARDAAGAITVVDYKLARRAPSLDGYAFQLRAYALALSRAHGDAPVRAGILFLYGAPEPVWLDGSGPEGALTIADHAAFERELAALAARLGEARATDTWPAEAKPTCEKLGCGFLTACHRTAARTGPRRSRR
ncbi:MAG TPA: 3'-5' exonuclease [Polyangiaceae bacterium]|nr:3'-5' exonuclease [Polyangiaceae bacterium]